MATIPERVTETEHIEPMGWYSVGPVCYREIRRRLEYWDKLREQKKHQE